MVRFIMLLVVALGVTSLSWGADEAIEKKITFDDHIKPIFREHCVACHSESDKESDLALDTYSGSLAGGSSGEVIASGNTGGSRLFALVTHAERPFMPPDQDPIDKAQLELIKVWIEQGMPENSGSRIKRSNNAAAAMLSTPGIGKPEGPPAMPESLLRQPVVVTKRSAAISAIAASPWAPLLAVGGQEQVSLYHCQSGELLGVIPFPEGEPQSLRFTRDGKQLLIGGGRHSHSGCAVLVDVVTGQRITKVGDELDIVLAADISPDKRRIAIAGPQKVIRVFDSVSGELVFEMKKHTDWIFSLRYSPDGVLLASGDRSNGLVVWEADTGRVYGDLVGHKGEVRDLDFRADSNVLASASMDGTIKLWDMYESKEIKSWNAHASGTMSVAFAHDGRLASSGRDANVKLWNANGEMQTEFKGLGEAALEVALTGDAGYVAGGDWNGNVQVWAVENPKQPIPVAANPPSIEQRIEQTQQELAAATQESHASQQAADRARFNAEEARALQIATKNRLEQLHSHSADSQAEQDAWAAELLDNARKIEQLELQLQEAKAAKQHLLAGADRARKRASEIVEQIQQEEAKLKSAAAEQATLTVAVQEAEATWELVSQRLALARKNVEQALADKAALDERAAMLSKLSVETATLAKQLAAKTTAALEATRARQAYVERSAAEELAAKEQLEAIRKRMEQAAAEHRVVQQAFAEAESHSQDLQRQLEKAEQEALRAQEQLDLFNQAYSSDRLQ
jgi:WD40 repeat protein